MSDSLIPLASPEIVRLTEIGRQVWNSTFNHKCQPTDLLTVEEVIEIGGMDCNYLIRMVSRVDQLWVPPEQVIRMRWLGFNNWEEVK